MYLFLDDDVNRAALAYQRFPKEKRDATVWVKTAADAITSLRDFKYQLIEVHLDHDLSGETFCDSRREDCGMEVVRYLESLPEEEIKIFESCKFICHSHNYPACSEMRDRLEALGLKAEYKPFGT